MKTEYNKTFPAYLVGNTNAESRDAYALYRAVKHLCDRGIDRDVLVLLVHHAHRCLVTAPDESITDVADRMVADAEQLLAEYDRGHRAKFSVTVTETRSRTVVLDCPASCAERAAEDFVADLYERCELVLDDDHVVSVVEEARRIDDANVRAHFRMEKAR